MPTVPPFIMGLMTEESQRLELLDDLRGLMTVLIALLSRFGVLLKLNARLTAMRVFDASLKMKIKTLSLFPFVLELKKKKKNDIPGGSS